MSDKCLQTENIYSENDNSNANAMLVLKLKTLNERITQLCRERVTS